MKNPTPIERNCLHKKVRNNVIQLLCMIGLMFFASGVFAQSLQVTDCPTIDKRNNGNGQYSSSAGNFQPAYSQNNPVAANVVGTPYQMVSFDPSTKTGFFTFIWSASSGATSFPVITRVWYAPVGSTVATQSSIQFGPPTPPTVVGSNFYVTYSFYNMNMPPTGKVTLEFTDPQTNQPAFTCTFDLGSNSPSSALAIKCTPTVSSQPASLTLCGASTASFSMTASGASAINWQVSSNGGSSWTNITNGGNYSGATSATLSISNPNSYDGYYYRAYLTGSTGCGDTFTRAALLIAKPKPTAAFTSTVQCGIGASSLGVNLTGSSPWSITYTSTPSGGSTTTTTVRNIISNPYFFSASPSATTTYAITAVSDLYCTNSAPTGSVSQTIYQQPTVTPSNATSCYGSGAFNLAFTSTQSPNRYTLSAGIRAMSGFSTISNATLSSSPMAISIPTSAPAGVYDFNLTVSNAASGCASVTMPFTVTVATNPTVAATAGSATVCAGSSCTLTAAPSGLSSYSWSLNPSASVIATGVSASVTVSSTSTYTVTATDANSCTASASVSVNTQSGPSLSVSASASSICTGGASILTASGGNTYTWSPSTGLSATSGGSVIASPASTTTYTVTSRDTASCQSIGTVTVTVANPTISVTSGSTICAGTIKTLTASGGSTYSWYPTTGLYTDAGATTAYTGTSLSTVYAKPTATTTYNVVGTNAGGCSGSASSTVTIAAAPVNAATSTASSVIFCTQGTTSFVLKVYTTSSVTSMTWSYSTTGSSYTTVTSATTITGVTLTPSNTVDSALLTLSGYGNSGYTGAKYFRLVIVSATCTYNYDIFITDTKSSSTSPAPTASANTICNGNSTILSIGNLASGSTAQWQSSPDSTTWTNITGATSSTYTATPSTNTYYRVVYNGGTGNCGSTSSKILITVASALSANTVSPATSCTDGHTTIALSGTAITGGIYQWQSSVTSSSSGFSDVLGATSQNYTLPTQIVATTTWFRRNASTSVCASSTSTAVAVYSPISNNLVTTSDTSFCNSAPAITLSGATPAGGSGSYTYQWMSSSNGSSYSNIGGATSASYTTSTASQTTYYKRIVNSGGCIDTTSKKTLKVNANPSLSVTSGTTICSGTTIALSASGALTYAWSPSTELSATTGSSISAAPTSSRTYTVTGTNINGCTASAGVAITVTSLPAVPTLSAASQTICSGSVSLTSKISTGTSPQWYTVPQANALYSVSTPTAVSAAGTYYTFASSGGCYSAAYASFTLTVANVATPTPATTSLSYCAPATADLTALQPSAAANTSLEWHTVSSGPSAGNLVSSPASVSSGTYYLYAYSSAGSCYGSASSAVAININATTSATVSSTSVSACAPATIDLTSYNSTSGTNTYNWYSGTTPSPAYEVAIPTQVSQSGTYYLFATNSSGCQGAVSPGVTVSINSKPSTSISSPDVYCGSVSRTINATSDATSTAYQWQLSADGGSSWSNMSNSSPYSGTTGSALTINPTTGLSGMYYRYTVTSGSGCESTSNPAVLVQETTPSISANPADETVYTGSTAYFSVAVTGSATANYQWQVSTDSGSTFTPISDDATYSGSSTTDLQIKPAASSMTGYLYNVAVSNSCTTTTSMAARLSSNVSPLPVTWLYFTAHKYEQSAILDWGTATEIDSRDFVVKRSSDCSDWTTIGVVTAAGNSNTNRNYSLTDGHPLTGTNYYQITQRDADGKSTLSAIVTVDFGAPHATGFTIYPNPIADGQMHLIADQAGDLTVYSSTGVLILSRPLSAGPNSVDLSGFAKGVYGVKINDQSTSVIIK